MNFKRTTPLTALLQVGPGCVAGLAITVGASTWFDGVLPGWALWPMVILLGLAYVVAVQFAESVVWRWAAMGVLSVGVGVLTRDWFPQAEIWPAAGAIAAMLAAGWIGWRGPAIMLRLRLTLIIGFCIYLVGLPLASVRGELLFLRLVGVGGWCVTFGLTAGWSASLLRFDHQITGRHQLAAYLYALNLYLAALIAGGS